MPVKGRRWFDSVLLCSFALAGCFIDNPNLAKSDGGGADASVADAGPSMCTRYGGYTNVEKLVNDLAPALAADCRIGAFITKLTDEQSMHLTDCLVKQMAVLTKCPGIRYDVDSSGEECRDMPTAHYGLGIRSDDFDAYLEDLLATMQADGYAQEDIDAVTPALKFLHDDIVTNSAPGLARQTCDAGAGGDGG